MVKQIVEILRPNMNNRQKSLSVTARIQILQQMKRMLIEQEKFFLKSLQTDLGKSDVEGYTSEIAVLLNEIDYVCKHVRRWMKPDRSYRMKIGYLEKIENKREPFGHVLIISPWNYQLQLSLMPAISAISAGNACVIKPSEFASATSELLEKIIHRYFPAEQLMVVTGDAEKAKELISLNFDMLFFTGSQTIGQKVYRQATEQMIPVVMELGGKSPCIIDETGYSKHTIKEILLNRDPIQSYEISNQY